MKRTKRTSQGKRQRQRAREYKINDACRELRNIPIADLCTDPDRFQYKLGADSQGSVNSLANVSVWSFAAEGVLDVWLDPADNQIYVVNGHNRLSKAKQVRPRIDYLPCKFLQAKDWRQAREFGAIANIAAGCGTALDAARFFRDGNWSPDRCKRYGIQLSRSIARDGLAIAKLPADLFSLALSGSIPESRAAILGSSGLDPEQLRSLVTAIGDRERSGKDCDDPTVRELITLARIAAVSTVEQFTLFGSETMARSLIFETAEIQSAIRSRLASDRRTFRAAVKNADRLESANVATVDTVAGSALAESAKTAIDIFDREKTAIGPISDSIRAAAEQLASNGDRLAIIESTYRAIDSILKNSLTE